MKARDAAAVSALRSALAAIDNAESVDAPSVGKKYSGPIAGAVSGLGAAEAPRRELSEDEIEDIVRAEVAERRAAAKEYGSLGRDDDGHRLTA